MTCVVSKTFETHLERLELIFDTLLRNGLRINAKKCEFEMNQVLFCGFRITAEGISPNAEKLAAIEKISVPSSVREVKTFLGMTGLYRCFVPGYATIHC